VWRLDTITLAGRFQDEFPDADIGAPEVRAYMQEITDERTITDTDPGGTETGDQSGEVLCTSGLIDRPGDETGHCWQPYQVLGVLAGEVDPSSCRERQAAVLSALEAHKLTSKERPDKSGLFRVCKKEKFH
jgi:hypothetical protein